LFAAALVLGGCAAPASTITPATAYPASGADATDLAADNLEATAYPPAESEATAAAGEGAGPGPAGVIARPNLSRVTARLVSDSASSTEGFRSLRVEVLTSAEIPGMGSFTNDLPGQEVELMAQSADLPVLAAGDTFSAEVEYIGDEHGGAFVARKINKIP
jgi:hypothetical protein